MILVINDKGDFLCRDDMWRGFATFGSGKSSVKMYRSLSVAKRKAKEVDGHVVLIEGGSIQCGRGGSRY